MLTIYLKYIYCSICRAIRCDTLKILWNAVFIFANNSKLVLIRHIQALLIIRVQAYNYNWLNYLSILKQFSAIFSLFRVFIFYFRLLNKLKMWHHQNRLLPQAMKKIRWVWKIASSPSFFLSFCQILLRQISIWSMK